MKNHKNDMDRAEYLKHLYEKFMSKVDHTKDLKGRAKEAQADMTEKLGEEWKDDADVEGLVFIEVEEPSKGKMQGRLDSYQERVDEEGDKAGMGVAPDAEEADSPEEEGFMQELMKLMEKYGKH